MKKYIPLLLQLTTLVLCALCIPSMVTPTNILNDSALGPLIEDVGTIGLAVLFILALPVGITGAVAAKKARGMSKRLHDVTLILSIINIAVGGMLFLTAAGILFAAFVLGVGV